MARKTIARCAGDSGKLARCADTLALARCYDANTCHSPPYESPLTGLRLTLPAGRDCGGSGQASKDYAKTGDSDYIWYLKLDGTTPLYGNRQLYLAMQLAAGGYSQDYAPISDQEHDHEENYTCDPYEVTGRYRVTGWGDAQKLKPAIRIGRFSGTGGELYGPIDLTVTSAVRSVDVGRTATRTADLDDLAGWTYTKPSGYRSDSGYPDYTPGRYLCGDPPLGLDKTFALRCPLFRVTNASGKKLRVTATVSAYLAYGFTLTAIRVPAQYSTGHDTANFPGKGRLIRGCEYETTPQQTTAELPIKSANVLIELSFATNGEPSPAAVTFDSWAIV